MPAAHSTHGKRYRVKMYEDDDGSSLGATLQRQELQILIYA